ncbi:MAG: PilW family protein [Nitrococcus sp.]|nr:PilW family protein [Nitrococcus sp.]
MARQSFPKYTSGFSLVEIMVALTLSLLLLGAVLQVFISAKASYRMNEGLARLQETGRFAANILAGDIRMAGYQGCMTLDKINLHVIVKDPPADLALYGPATILTGENNLASTDNSGDNLVVNHRAVAGSDSLTIRKASATGAHLTGNTTSNNAQVHIDGNPTGFEQGDILIITDCADADIFRATTVSNNNSSMVDITHGSNFNDPNKLSKTYGPDATVMAFESITYYVADTTRTNEAGDPIYGFYVQRLDMTEADQTEEVELVAGVENMQVLYGVDIDADGSVDNYVNADNVTDFTNVISARVALLVSSVAPSTTQPDSATYDLLDETVDPANGRYLRNVFTFTATARNRSLRSTMFN